MKYPLLVQAASLDPDDVADAFARAAQLAPTVTPQQRAAAREFATRFERSRQEYTQAVVAAGHEISRALLDASLTTGDDSIDYPRVEGPR